jgi:hypothetical protein
LQALAAPPALFEVGVLHRREQIAIAIGQRDDARMAADRALAYETPSSQRAWCRTPRHRHVDGAVVQIERDALDQALELGRVNEVHRRRRCTRNPGRWT